MTRKHITEHVGVCGMLPDRRNAVAAPDAGHDLEERGRTLAGLGRLQSGTRVHPADRGEAASDGGRGRP